MGGKTWHASMAHLDSVSPRKAKAEPSGEENHCIQFGLAAGEQRWGIEGASVWSSIGQFALDNVSRWIETCPPPQSPAWKPQDPTNLRELRGADAI